MTGSRVLKVALANYGYTRPLKDRTVAVPGVRFDFVEVAPTHEIFRRMIQEQAFDIAEMALTTFMAARFHEKPVVALAVPLMRMFHHRTIWCRADAGITSPRDLEGRKVAVRSYAQTGPTWSRGILQNEYGVDLNRVTWVTFEGSHVPEYRDPANTERAPAGKTLRGMLEAGEVDAAISLDSLRSERVRPLFDDGKRLEYEWFRKTGIYPINHIVVVRKSLIASEPGLSGEIFAAFGRAKDIYLEGLIRHGPKSPEDEAVQEFEKLVGGDPLPYGIEPNRVTLEAMMNYACQQRIVPMRHVPDELFDLSFAGSAG